MMRINKLGFGMLFGLIVVIGGCDVDDQSAPHAAEVLEEDAADDTELAGRPSQEPDAEEFTEDLLFDSFSANQTPSEGPDGKTCCARCNSHQAYHALWGIDYNCNFYAQYWCSQYNRGGLNDAAWLYVPSQCMS